MTHDLPRREFLVLVAAGAGLAACGGDTSSPTTTTIGTQPLVAEILADEDLASWFADPASVAELGNGRLGEQLLGDCGIATPTTISTREQFVAAIETERACGSLVQIGGWFMTPTEAAIAQEVAARLGLR